jgi:DNA-binding beta-propeller fold protein YncE
MLWSSLATVVVANPGALLLGTSPSAPGASRPNQAFAQAPDYEVWVLDQADTRPDGGGTLRIYQGADLSGKDPAAAKPEVIDLGATLRDVCITQTGSAPRRPHLLAFNPSGTHAILSFVASGHVLFLDTATRRLAACFDAGVQAHAAIASPDERYVIVANQNGKLLQRIRTDYANNAFVLENDATLDLANGVTPSGAPREDATLRPDNAPIWPLIESSNRFTFLTLRGGGLFVVDNLSTPMRIVGEYDQATIRPNGVVASEANGKAYLVSGGGTPALSYRSDLNALPISAFSTTPNAPNTPAPKLVFTHDARGAVDAHGTVLVRGRYLWVSDRAANRLIVVDTQTDQVVNEILLAGPVSSDPAPDLLDISPDGNTVFVALRGPTPLTGNSHHVDNAVGKTPGMGIIRVEDEGRKGTFVAVSAISHIVGGTEMADPHVLRVRRK